MQIHDEISDFRQHIKLKVTGIIRNWSKECYARHPVLNIFSWRQSLFAGPKDRDSVINGLQIDGTALICTQGIKDYLFQVETDFAVLRKRHPLFVNEMEGGKEIQLAEAIEEIIDFFHLLCTPEFCAFFGNRFEVHVSRDDVVISEIKI